MTVARCENRLPASRRCNTPMTESVDPIGRVLWHCQRCAARAAGHCWQCGKPRENPRPTAAYCRSCKERREALNKRVGRMTEQQIERRRKNDQKRRAKPDYRQKNTAHKRDWMRRHPEKYPEYAEKARLRWHKKRANPAWWERQKAMQRARYAERMAAKRAATLDETRRGSTFDEAGQPPATL